MQPLCLDTSCGCYISADISARKYLIGPLIRNCCMDLLQACEEMKGFIETAQKLIESWEADPDNYSKLEEGLTAMKAELAKFKG